ncbi:30S ribosomal protein S28e [Candidatus Woesearchaeota archaeon]|jgi:small subunit ribosomal protein S28e|nr:30S ribosomal protein S28e [Candidatus Woesearchaeota archaeon]MBT7062333.1 30S ribosomal protein S28e [Candidatus Woesearchaeota archaeon]MBT7403160.1 30S ribosomal protein S28e [Candidatus Woesearchaeota archaeon]
MSNKQGKKTKEGKGGVTAVEQSEIATPAEVVEIIGGLGTRQGGKQVRCKILDGRDVGKVMRRNVYGAIRIGDILMLKQTEIEAQPLKGGRK